MISSIFSSLLRSESKLSSLGHRPWSGESDPPRTWYSPVNTPVCSIARRSAYSSITQMVCESLVSLLQYLQLSTSLSLRPLQIGQVAIFFSTKRSLSESSCRSHIFFVTIKNASFIAVFSPIPGSFARASISCLRDSGIFIEWEWCRWFLSDLLDAFFRLFCRVHR